MRSETQAARPTRKAGVVQAMLYDRLPDQTDYRSPEYAKMSLSCLTWGVSCAGTRCILAKFTAKNCSTAAQVSTLQATLSFHGCQLHCMA